MCARIAVLPLAAVLCFAHSRALSAQSAGHGRLHATVSVGAAGPATALSQDDGVEVRTTTGPLVGLELMRETGAEAVGFGLFGRVAITAVDLRVAGASYGAGNVTQGTLGVRAARRVSRAVSLRAGLGASWVHGPSDVRPYSSGSSVHPAGDLMLGLALGRAESWAVDVGGSGYLVTSTPDSKAGMVAGVLLELRRAF